MIADVRAEAGWSVFGVVSEAESGVCTGGRLLHLQGSGGHSDSFFASADMDTVRCNLQDTLRREKKKSRLVGGRGEEKEG